MKELSLPIGAKKYKEMDLSLLNGEKIERILDMRVYSRLQSFILCGLISLFAFVLYDFFSHPIINTESLILPFSLSILIYFIWHYRAIESSKNLVSIIIRYCLSIVILSYLVSFVISLFNPILPDPFLPNLESPSFSLNPIKSTQSMLSITADFINGSLMEYSFYLRLGCLGLLGASLAVIPFVYYDAKGRLYYVTNKRIIVRMKSGSIQITTLPLDNLVEVTAFQGLFGRLLSYGDIILTMTNGGMVSNSLHAESTSSIGSLYQIRRRLEGLKDVLEIKDLIISLRERYVHANYLENMEKELVSINKAITEKPEATYIT